MIVLLLIVYSHLVPMGCNRMRSKLKTRAHPAYVFSGSKEEVRPLTHCTHYSNDSAVLLPFFGPTFDLTLNTLFFCACVRCVRQTLLISNFNACSASISRIRHRKATLKIQNVANPLYKAHPSMHGKIIAYERQYNALNSAHSKSILWRGGKKKQLCILKT